MKFLLDDDNDVIVGYISDFKNDTPLLNVILQDDIRSFKLIAKYGMQKFTFNAKECDYLVQYYNRDMNHHFIF